MPRGTPFCVLLYFVHRFWQNWLGGSWFLPRPPYPTHTLCIGSDPTERVFNPKMAEQSERMKVGESSAESSVSTSSGTAIPASVTSFVASGMARAAETAGKAVTSGPEVTVHRFGKTGNDGYDNGDDDNEKEKDNFHSFWLLDFLLKKKNINLKLNFLALK